MQRVYSHARNDAVLTPNAYDKATLRGCLDSILDSFETPCCCYCKWDFSEFREIHNNYFETTKTLLALFSFSSRSLLFFSRFLVALFPLVFRSLSLSLSPFLSLLVLVLFSLSSRFLLVLFSCQIFVVMVAAKIYVATMTRLWHLCGDICLVFDA